MKRRRSKLVHPQFSVLAMLEVDRARRARIAPDARRVRELELRAEKLARGFWQLAGVES